MSRYEDALRYLRTLRVPRWRRPNENGNWGIVTGQRWEEVHFHDQ
jgi:hypothetical protein